MRYQIKFVDKDGRVDCCEIVADSNIQARRIWYATNITRQAKKILEVTGIVGSIQ